MTNAQRGEVLRVLGPAAARRVADVLPVDVDAVEAVRARKVDAALDERRAAVRRRGHLGEERRVVDAAGVLARPVRHRPAADGEGRRAARVDLVDPVVEAPREVEVVVLVRDDREVVRHEEEGIVQLASLWSVG